MASFISRDGKKHFYFFILFFFMRAAFLEKNISELCFFHKTMEHYLKIDSLDPLFEGV
jgi:hypothetical protein